MPVNVETQKSSTEHGINGFPEHSEPAPAIRIVIADSHKVLREGVRRLLSAERGLQVIGEAADPDAMVKMVEYHQPEVVLLSASLGGESEIDMLRRLEASKCVSRVIVMTQSTQREDHVRAIRFGASGIMTHDTSSDMLAKGIRKVCEGELWVDRRAAAEAMRQMIAARTAAPAPRVGPGQRGTASLSKREREVAALVAQGFKNKDIAERLFISEQTVKNHMHNIFEKLGVTDRLELALLAIHHGLI